MNTDVLIKKIQGNMVNIVILGVSIFIAFKIYHGKQNEFNALKEKQGNEIKKNEVMQDIDKLQKDIETMKKVVNNKVISDVISKLGNIARESQIKIVFIKPQPEMVLSGGVYSKYPFEMSVTTNSYHKIGNFIGRIEKSAELYKVEDLTISSNSKTSEDKISAKIALSTILIKD
jgi:Tfp pilus assembly protein PilO